MTAPVETQLRDYFTMLDRMQGTADIPTPVRPLHLVDTTPTDTEDIMLDANRTDRSRAGRPVAVVVGAAAALVVLIGAITLVIRGDDDEAPAEPPPSVVDDLAPLETVPDDLGFPSSRIDPGRYETKLLGVRLAMTLAGEWTLTEARASEIALRRAGDDGDSAPERWLHLVRLGGWNTGAQATDPAFRGTGTIDATDVDGWLADNPLIELDRRSARVGGRDALVLDVVVDPVGEGAPLDFPRDAHTAYNDSCTAATAPCIWYRSLPPESETGRGHRPDPVIHAGQIRRMWVVAVDDEPPILIEAVAGPDDLAWLDQIEAVTVDSMELGPSAPPVEVS